MTAKSATRVKHKRLADFYGALEPETGMALEETVRARRKSRNMTHR